MSTNLYEYLKFIVVSRQFRCDRYREELRKNLFMIPLQERQRNSAYSEWLKYLKMHGLYVKYRINIARLLSKRREEYSAQRVGKEAKKILEVVTDAQLLASIDLIDSWNYKYGYFNSRYWKKVYDEYLLEKEYGARKTLLSRKLYHMDAPQVKHSKFIGSVKPRQHILEDLIDKLFFIKK